MAKHNKTDILDKGIEMIRTNGYNGTGIQQILKACKIPKGSFYNFFNSKQDFALQAIDRYTAGPIAGLKELANNERMRPINKIRIFW